MREAFRAILEDADLVKFARRSPGPTEAREFLERCRGLLNRWHTSHQPAALTDAIR
jgi:hypothetical protein